MNAASAVAPESEKLPNAKLPDENIGLWVHVSMTTLSKLNISVRGSAGVSLSVETTLVQSFVIRDLVQAVGKLYLTKSAVIVEGLH